MNAIKNNRVSPIVQKVQKIHRYCPYQVRFEKKKIQRNMVCNSLENDIGSISDGPIHMEMHVKVISEDNTILPEFFQKYVMHLCNPPGMSTANGENIGGGSIGTEVHECLNTYYIPDAKEQYILLETLHDIMNQIPIQMDESIQASVIHYLIRHDTDSVNTLLKAYQMHFQSLEVLRSMVSAIWEGGGNNSM